jgi:hypothetical protein
MGQEFRVNVPFVRAITGSLTTTVAPNTIYLYSLQYSCSNAGTGWGLKIQDRSPTPNVLYQIAALAVSTVPVVVQNLNFPIPILGGLDIITTGTPGVVTVWGNYGQN